MTQLRLLTWNMQGGNEQKWTKVLQAPDGIKCLQECSSPSGNLQPANMDWSPRPSEPFFDDTKEREVLLACAGERSGLARHATKLMFGGIAVTSYDYRGRRAKIVKFAQYGPLPRERLKKRISRIEEVLSTLGTWKDRLNLKDASWYKGPPDTSLEALTKMLDSDIEYVKKQRMRALENADAVMSAEVNGKYRQSRCNMGILWDCTFSTVEPDLEPLPPKNDQLHRHVQAVRVQVTPAQTVLVFNMHAVSNRRKSWSYFESFIPKFNGCMRPSDVAWICLGDFNLDAEEMRARLLAAKAEYPNLHLLRPDENTHFSRTVKAADTATTLPDDPDLTGTATEDDLDDDNDLIPVSQRIQDNDPKLKTAFKGSCLDYAVIRYDENEFNKAGKAILCWAEVSGFLSDHRAVRIKIDIDLFNNKKPDDEDNHERPKKTKTKMTKKNEEEEEGSYIDSRLKGGKKP